LIGKPIGCAQWQEFTPAPQAALDLDQTEVRHLRLALALAFGLDVIRRLCGISTVGKLLISARLRRGDARLRRPATMLALALRLRFVFSFNKKPRSDRSGGASSFRVSAPSEAAAPS
jgi:hypothetical protein